MALAACTSFKQSGAGAGPADAASGDGSPGPGGPSGMDGAAGQDSPASGDDGPPSSGDGGADCDGASCPIETVVGNLNQGTLVLVDDTNVYFGDEGTITGNVYQCPKSGCAKPTPLGPGFATGLGTDGKNVYWNDFAGGAVVGCAIGGCANQPMVLAPDQTRAEGVTFDGTNLYWASSGSVLTCLPPACTTLTAIATGVSTTLVDVASQDGVAYFVSGGSLESCPVAGCGAAPTVIAPASGTSVVVKNGFVYFTSNNAVVSCPTTEACAHPHTIGASDDPYGLGTDGVDLYWLDDIDAVVYRCPVTGCNVGAEHFADGQLSQPGANVALDGEYAYWTVPEAVLRKHK